MDDDNNLAPENGRRRQRWARRLVAQRLVDFRAAGAGSWDIPGRRLAGCGRWTFDDYVDVRGKVTDRGLRVYPVGTQNCARIWDCMVCSSKIRTRRQLEISAAAAVHVGMGGTLAMLTLTMRHHDGDELAALMDALKEGKRRLERLPFWRVFKKLALVGTITATEVTYGRNGWHPHLHILLFIKPGFLDPEATVTTFLADGAKKWKATIARELAVSPDLAHGWNLKFLDAQAAQYIAKIGAEVARADLKGDSRSPWQLLDHVADGESWAVSKWEEYQRVTRGRRAISWGRGLKALLLPNVPELTDEEAVAADVNGVLLDAIPKGEWRTWATTRIAGTVLAVLQLEDYERRGLPEVPYLHPVLADDPPGL